VPPRSPPWLPVAPLANILHYHIGLGEAAEPLQCHGAALQLIECALLIGAEVACQASRPAATPLFLIVPELPILIAKSTGPAFLGGREYPAHSGLAPN
jgi:hypothetical protein